MIQLNPHLLLPDGSCAEIRGSCTIGRSRSNQLVLAEDGVSRRHALIHAQGLEEFWLLDQGSINGTHLNRKPVVQPTRLRDGDVIRIGSTEIKFHQPHFPALVGESLNGSTMVQVRTTRCWLMLADIEGFTNLSQELDPAALALRIGKWLVATRSIVESHQGSIHKYLGDGWLGGWHEEAVDLVHIASCLLELVAHQKAEGPRFRLALHFGSVSLSGAGTGGEQGMIGPDLNFLFRMEKLAGALDLGLLLSKRAKSRLEGHFLVESVGCFPLKGFSGDFEFFA